MNRLSDAQREAAAAHVALAYRMAARYHARAGGDFDEHASNALWGLVEAASVWGEKADPATGKPYALGTLMTLFVRRSLTLDACLRHTRPDSDYARDAALLPLPPYELAYGGDDLGEWLARDFVEEMLARLPLGEAAAVRACVIDGDKYAAAARILGLGSAFVARRLCLSGLTRLYERLGAVPD